MKKLFCLLLVAISCAQLCALSTDFEEYTEQIAQPFFSSPVSQAIVDGDIQALESAIRQGFDVNQPDDKGQTPLYKAVIVNREDILRLLLVNGADPLISANNGFIPLLLAAQNGSNNLITALLENNGTANAQLDYRVPQPYSMGWTALHTAVYKGNDDTVELLLSLGADPNIQTFDGYDALAFAQVYRASSAQSIIEKYIR